MKHFLSRIMLVVISTGMLQTAAAEPTADKTTGSSLTLSQVLERVISSNPELVIYKNRLLASQSRIKTASQTRPLQLKIELDNFASDADIDNTETSISLIKVLEPGAVTDNREALARQSSLLLQSQQDYQRIELLAAAAEQFIHVVIDQQKLDIARQKYKYLEDIARVVSRRVTSGKSHIVERRQARINLARAQLELEHAEHELKSSQRKMAMYWGQETADFTDLQADLFQLDKVSGFTTLENLLDDNLELVSLISEQSMAQTRLKLAQANKSSNMELAAGIRHLDATDSNALTFSLSIPFGSSSRAQPEIEAQQHLLHNSSLAFQQKKLELKTMLYQTYQELLHAKTAVELLKQTILPEAKKAASDYEKGYKIGRFSLLELNQAYSSLLDAKLESVLSAARFHQLKITIERLTGTSLSLGAHNEK